MAAESVADSFQERERRRRRETGGGESAFSFGTKYKRYDERSIGRILDHVHRVCFRPAVPTQLQAEVAKKLGISRRALARGAGALEIIKPLYDLTDAFHQLAYKMSSNVQQELQDINCTMKEAADYSQEEYIHRVMEASSTTINREVEGYVLKKQLKDAQTNVKALSDLTEIMFVVKNAANSIQRERPYLKGDLFETEENLVREVEHLDKMESVLRIVESAEHAVLPKNVSSKVNVCLARTRRVLQSSSASLILENPLFMLKKAIDSCDEKEVNDAVKYINTTIDNYDNFQMSLSLSK